nr:GNAT family N-acetyltransferase [Pseudoalteromonas sp. Of7M-16]
MIVINVPRYKGLAQLTTKRLLLRQWQGADKPIFAQMGADPDVMRYFPNQLDKHSSDRLCDKISSLIAERGYGFWAVALQDGEAQQLGCTQPSRFIGFVGLHWQTTIKPEQPFMEVGWRLHRDYWGRGYAFEAAQAALNFAFNTLHLEQVYAFTALQNTPSQQLMKRLGMYNTGRDFAHPELPNGHALQMHCLYRISSEGFSAQSSM